MKLRKNRLAFLALAGTAAYLVYKEAKKNPELVNTAKEHWSNVKEEANRMAREARFETDQFIDEVEKKSEAVTDDVWESVDGTLDKAEKTIHNAQENAEKVAEDLKDSAVDPRDEFYRP